MIEHGTKSLKKREAFFNKRSLLIIPLLGIALIPRVRVCAQDARPEIAFVSDTQAPMWVEDIFLHSNQNEKATGLIFADLLRLRPQSLFILGDVVSLGYKEKKWKTIDSYLDECRRSGIKVSALLGNHEVMTRAKKGEQRFQKRFPDHALTGSVQIIDSVAVVLLNSNFKKLSSSDIGRQQAWLKVTIESFEADPGILGIILTCHHAPYSNSKIVGSSTRVQHYFVPSFIQSKKCRLFLTGHSHAYEHFRKEGKDFLVIGGGGGLHQPLSTSPKSFVDISRNYKPMFHYLTMHRDKKNLVIISHFLKEDFSGFEKGDSFVLSLL